MLRRKLLTYLLCPLAASLATSPATAAKPQVDEFGELMSGFRDEDNSSNQLDLEGGYSLRLTPAPDTSLQLQAPKVDLNGTWHIKTNPENSFYEKNEGDFSQWETIEVPSDFWMEGITDRETQAGYMRTFTIPAEWEGQRIKLRCDEIASACKVWVNDQQVGEHMGHFIAFELDITDAAVFGGENKISILVSRNSLARNLSGYSVHPGGGITRKIYAFPVPEVNIAQMHISTNFDDQYEDATTLVQLEVANESNTNATGLKLNFQLTDANGKVVPTVPSSADFKDVPAGESARQTIRLKVEKPLHWTAETPNLYTIKTNLSNSDTNLQTTSRRVGFREIEIVGKKLYVNGQPVKLRGSNRHMAHPIRGRALTPALDRQDAEMFKAANCNFIRTSHYPPTEEFIEACNEIGLYVEVESPFCFFGENDAKNYEESEYAPYIIYANLKTVQRDKSHPSVLFWSTANESWYGHFREATRLVAQFDTSRPRTAMWFPQDENDRDYLPIMAAHYPGVNGVIEQRDRPTVFSEYVHLPAYAPDEMVTDPSVDDSWGDIIKLVWNTLYPTESGLGAAIWCGVDDTMYGPEVKGENPRYGVSNWGVIDGWRRPKPEYWHTFKTYSPAYIEEDKVTLSASAKTIEVPIQNRYNFTNLSELTINWQIGEKSGQIAADVAAHTSGVLSIPAPAGISKDDVLNLTFKHASGRLVNQYALPFSKQAPSVQSGESGNVAWKLTKNGNAITVVGGQASWKINGATGKIHQVDVAGKPVIIGGPHFSYLTTFSKAQQTAMKKRDGVPFSGIVDGWKLSNLSVQDGATPEVFWEGTLATGSLKGSYRFLKSGEVEIDYSYTPDFLKLWNQDDLVQTDVKAGDHMFKYFSDDGKSVVLGGPGKGKGSHFTVPIEKTFAIPRQVGLELELPLNYDTVEWHCQALWTTYPEDHIGRPKGTAKAFPVGSPLERGKREAPTNAWSADVNALGSRDFRATKQNIYSAKLTDGQERSLEVISDGTQNARPYVHGEQINLLVDNFGGGPSEAFMGHFYGKGNRRQLGYGETVNETIRLKLR